MIRNKKILHSAICFSLQFLIFQLVEFSANDLAVSILGEKLVSLCSIGYLGGKVYYVFAIICREHSGKGKMIGISASGAVAVQYLIQNYVYNKYVVSGSIFCVH